MTAQIRKTKSLKPNRETITVFWNKHVITMCWQKEDLSTKPGSTYTNFQTCNGLNTFL